MKRCTRCILPETFPGITFDKEGVCNYCNRSRSRSATESHKKSYFEKFQRLIEEYAGKGSYDVIMAYSGGKDSTYTLYIFTEIFKLRVLALTFDNTFISPTAFKNINSVCDKLDVDSMIVRPAPGMLRTIFRAAAEKELYSPKTLERASTICTSCIGMVKAIILKTALEKEIPFIGFGWSPGQAPVSSSVMHTNPALMKKAVNAIRQPLRDIVGPRIDPLFPEDDLFDKALSFPWNIHPLAFMDYDEKMIIQKNRTFGWVQPQDTDPNSSNCLLNAFANHVHRNRYGFHPYVWEMANMVRDGVIDRTEALEKIEPPENQSMVEYCRKRLGPIQ